MSVNTMWSAPESAGPNDSISDAVREYRCGWNATTMRRPSVRAAASTAAISVG